jgi:hypothetical protein
MSIGSSNQQFNDPAFSNFQQNPPQDQIQVTTGPGGGTTTPSTIAGGDPTIFQSTAQTFTAPSKDLKVTGMGVGTASDPTLSLPTSQTPFTMDASSLLGSILSNMTQTTDLANSVANPNINDIPDLFGQGGGNGTTAPSSPDKPFDSGLLMATPSDLLSTDKTTVYNALVKYTGLNGNQSSSIASTLDQMATQIAAQNKNGPIPQLASGDSSEISNFLASLIPQNNSLTQQELSTLQSGITAAASSISTNEYISGLSSSNKDDVYNAMLSFTDINNNKSLSDDQKTEFTALLKQLSENIASQTQNSGKPDPALTSFDSTTLTTYLSQHIDTSQLSDKDQQAFQGILGNAGSDIASLNSASGVPPALDAIMTGMQSTNVQDVETSMQTMLLAQGITQAQINSIASDLTTLATNIAQKNGSGGSGLDITDAASMQTALIALLGTTPTDPVLIAAIGGLSSAYAAENTAYYTALAQSTNQSVVLDALVHLSNINNNPNLTPDEKAAAINYLKAMAAALAFMATIRATVARLDAELRQEETQGKLSTIKDQTASAKQAYTSGLLKLQNQLKQTMDALAMQALMKWLGPFIAVLLAIIAILVMCIPEVGEEIGPIIIGIMIAFIVCMTVLVIVDMETGCLKELGKKMGIPDGPGQDAISFAIQAIMLALMCVVTFGLASPAVAAMVAAEGAEIGAEVSAEVVSEAVEQVTEQLLTQVMKKTINLAIQEAVSALFGSGLVTDSYKAIAKASGMSDDDQAKFSMILTMVTMVVAMAAAYKCCAGLATEEATGAVKTMVKTAVEEAEESATTAAATAGKTVRFADEAEVNLETDVKNVGDDAADAADDAKTANVNLDATPGSAGDVDTTSFLNTMKRLSKKLAEMLKPDTSPIAVIMSLLKLVETGTSAGASIMQGISQLNQADMSRTQAAMEVANSHAEAMMQELGQLVQGFDMTQKDLDSTSSDFLKMYNNLMTLFANMVSSASKIVSNTTQIGS